MIFVIQLGTETMDEVYTNTKIKLKLQPLNGESLKCNTSVEARLGIAAREFWQRGEITFFDIRGFNPNAKSFRNQQIQFILLPKNEKRNSRKTRE